MVAVSAPHVVWAALSQERPQRSSWTRAGEPLSFVPYDDDWEPDTEPVEFVGMYEQSLETYADRVPAARIPVERIQGEVLLVAGGDDRLWPSCDFAERIVDRRSAAGLRTELVSHPRAGHRVVLPGEGRPRPRTWCTAARPRRTRRSVRWCGRTWRSCWAGVCRSHRLTGDFGASTSKFRCRSAEFTG